MNDNEQEFTPSPEENRIMRMARERLAEQQAALDPDVSRTRPNGKGLQGPRTGHTVEVVRLAKVVGRNKTPVVPEEVEHLASLGCNDNEIAKFFGITDHALRRNFEAELVAGRHKLRVSLRQAQIRVALEGQPTMLVWLGKNLLSQNENGQANDDNRPLPWTDEMEADSEETDDMTEAGYEDEDESAN